MCLYGGNTIQLGTTANVLKSAVVGVSTKKVSKGYRPELLSTSTLESHMWNTSPQATSAPRRAWMAPERAMYLIKAFFFFKLGSTCAQIPCTQKWSSISFLFSGHVSQMDFKLLMRLPTGMRSGFSKVILPIFVVL